MNNHTPNPPSDSDIEQKIKSLEQRMVHVENKLSQENLLIQKQLRQTETDHREIQAEKLSLTMLARDLAMLQKTLTQIYRRISLIMAFAAAILSGGYIGSYIRSLHTTSSYNNTQPLSIAGRFFSSLSPTELNLIVAIAGALAAVISFFLTLLLAKLIKWLFVDFQSSIYHPLKSKLRSMDPSDTPPGKPPEK